MRRGHEFLKPKLLCALILSLAFGVLPGHAKDIAQILASTIFPGDGLKSDWAKAKSLRHPRGGSELERLFVYKKAVAIYPYDWKIWYTKARLEEQLAMREALKSYLKAIELARPQYMKNANHVFANESDNLAVMHCYWCESIFCEKKEDSGTPSFYEEEYKRFSSYTSSLSQAKNDFFQTEHYYPNQKEFLGDQNTQVEAAKSAK